MASIPQMRYMSQWPGSVYEEMVSIIYPLAMRSWLVGMLVGWVVIYGVDDR